MAKRLLTYEMIEETIPQIPGDDFTVLDYIDVFASTYPAVWDQIVARYGVFGEGRQYTSSNYVSLLIQRYSWREDSLLRPHKPWTIDKERDFRMPTEAEKRRTGGAIIAVYRKV